MAHPYHHSLSSAKSFGGTWEEHYPLHSFLDSSKEIMADPRHRGLYHQKSGAKITEMIFGKTFANIKTKKLTKQHIMEDLEKIPSITDWYPLNGLNKKVLDNKKAEYLLKMDDPKKEILRRYPFPKEEKTKVKKCLDLLFVPLDVEKIEDIRALFYFTSVGPFLCEKLVGPILISTPTRYAIEWVIKQAWGDYIPSFQDFIGTTPIEDWMYKKAGSLSQYLK